MAQKEVIELAAELLEEIQHVIPLASWRRVEPAPGPGDFYEGTATNWRITTVRFGKDLYDGGAIKFKQATFIRLPRDIARAAVEAAELKLKEENP